MGSNRLISKDKSKVEVTSLTELFEKQCPIYMSYGMSYDEFWHGDLYLTKFYRESYLIQVKQKDEELWMQGMYIYEALCKVSPILHAFSKKGTKPLQYRTKPMSEEIKENKTEKEKDIQIKQERMKARIFFERWARATKKHFENQ